MAYCSRETTAELKFSAKSFDLGLHTLVFEQIHERMITGWGKTKNELKRVLGKKKLKRDERSYEFSALKISLLRIESKVKCLLAQMKSIQEVQRLESKRWEMRFVGNVEKAESVLIEMKRMSEKEGLGSPVLEMQLEEHIAKSELLLEEMELIRVLKKVKSPMLEIELKEHIQKVNSLLEKLNLKREESNMVSTVSPVLRMQLQEIGFLLKELEMEEWSAKLKPLSMEMLSERHMVNLKLLLEEMNWEQSKEGERFQMLELELKKDTEGFESLPNEMGPPRDIGMWNTRLKQRLAKEASLLEKMKSLEKESRIMHLKEHAVEFETLLKDRGSLKSEDKLKFQVLKIEFYSNMVRLESLLEKLKLEEKEKEMKLKELEPKLEIVLAEIQLSQNGKGSVAKLKEHIAEAKSLLLEMKCVQQESKLASTLILQLQEQTVELESLLEKMKIALREFPT